MPWSSRLLLSVVMGRLCSLKAAAVRDVTDGDEDEDLLIHAADNMWGYQSFRFGLSWLNKQTGLSRDAIVRAKRDLAKRGVVLWYQNLDEDGSTKRDMLAPNFDFRVRVTPIKGEPGRGILAYLKGT